ncbi:MAG: bifunctional biotin--[acetyl-CoA-carboxylase] synthetase/biotin operon repressor [Gammaproteobacteria bacterium]|nr:MAG: bifunctional biotin--[acetyl-CoA-carboxylase] synthetase/biotin operon repressor [Gammaproteobacteria bacterium]
MLNTSLLPLLADGEFRSGQDLADALGVSRTAVWKQFKKLGELGLPIESVKGRGYRIPGGIELLDDTTIRRFLQPEAAGLLRALEILETVGSTNARAMRRAEQGPAAGMVYTAEQQSAGRGRRGRQWVSPYAGNLYLSLVWEFGQGAAALEGLSLAVGVAVARALAACGIGPVQLKWPNDVLFEGSKLGGILLEMTGDAAGACQVVIGVGLNVSMPQASAGAIDQAWTDIDTITGREHPGRNTLLAALLNELLPLVARFEDQGFAHWRDDWQVLDAFAGEHVVLHTGAQQTAGVARGVDERGALQLETTTGLQSVYGGEISMRPAP